MNLWSLKIECWESFSKKVFKKIKPKKIIFLSYYGFDAITSVMSAANKLNIKTVDLQHGPQTNTHMHIALGLKYLKKVSILCLKSIRTGTISQK